LDAADMAQVDNRAELAIDVNRSAAHARAAEMPKAY